jgi:hypothetical protein
MKTVAMTVQMAIGMRVAVVIAAPSC